MTEPEDKLDSAPDGMSEDLMCEVCHKHVATRSHCDYHVCSSEHCFEVAVDNVASRRE